MPRLYWLSATPRVAALRNHCDGVAVVRLAVDAFRIQHREIVDRLGVALVGGLQIERARLVQVLLHALALLVKAAEAVLRGREAVIGGALEPLRGEFQIGRHAAAFGVAHADLVFGGRIAGGGGGAQRRVRRSPERACRRAILRRGRGVGGLGGERRDIERRLLLDRAGDVGGRAGGLARRLRSRDRGRRDQARGRGRGDQRRG